MANTGVKLHGKGGAIYIGGAKGSGGVRLAAKTEWSLSRARDYVDATSFGDSNKVYLAGLPDVTGNFSGLLDTSGDLLLNAATSDAQQLFLYASDGTLPGSDTTLVAHGPGLIDASVTVSSTDAARITGNFRASDAWVIDLGA